MYISKILIILGFLSLTFGTVLLWERNNPNRLSFAQYQTQIVSSEQAMPTRISIPSLKISLPVVPSYIINRTWTTTDQGVSYLVSSPIPGQKGNSIMYGHNWNNLLGNLDKAKPGEKITISYINGETKIFTIVATTVVTPDQTRVLSSTDDYRITIYTCTGFLDSKRFVVTAIYDNTRR